MSGVIDRLNAALEGRYRIERELGEGGMATVFLADDLRHDRKVALKVLKPELAAVVGAERFLAEIKTTANLQHPHILPLFDSGEADSFLFYVMPYVEGESLREKLEREQQLPVEDALAITEKVAAALQYAHEQGVVHRDIKPANILMSRGEPLVADFGIALALGSAGARLTETGLSMGTPYYMSPEQALGDQPVTESSDTYALACVLYELLAGSPPHTGPTAQAVLARIIAGHAPPVREQRPSVPPNVDAALRRALERVPADRFPSPGAFARATADPSFRYGEAEAEAAALAAGRRSRWLLGLAGALALGALVGWGLATATRAEDGASAGASRPLQLTFSGQAARPAITPEGDAVAYVNESCRQGSFGDCTHALRVQEVGATQSVEVLAGAVAIGTPRWTHDGSLLLVDAVLDADRMDVFALPRMGGAVRPVAPLGPFAPHPSADSVVVAPAAAEADGYLLVIDLASGAVADSLHVGDQVNALAWHPDGSWIAVRTPTTVRVMARDGRTLDEVSVMGRPHIRWNVAGTAILYFRVGVVREDDLVRRRVDSGGRMSDEAEVVRGGVPTIYQGAFDLAARSGRLVLSTGDARADIWTFERAGSSVRAARRTGGTTWYGLPDIAPDGSAIFYLRGDGVGDNVYRLELATGAEEALTASRTPGGWTTTLSSDGQYLAYRRVSERTPFLEVIHLPSRRVTNRAINRPFHTAIPLGDGRFVLAGSRLEVLDSLTAEPEPIPGVRPLYWSSSTVAPGGSRVVYLAEEDTARGSSLVMQSLDGGSAEVLATLEGEEFPPGLSWKGADLYLGRWLPGEAGTSLWRWDAEGGGLERVADLGVACNPVTVAVDRTGRAGTCQTEEDRYDIWAFEGLGR